MKEIVVLRHGEKSGDDLTLAGAAACKRLAQRIGVFDIALASPRNRAIQTAALVSRLSVTVDEQASVPGFPEVELKKLEDAQRSHPLGIIGAIWQNPVLVEDARIAGLKLLDLVQDTLVKLHQNERALIVSHDGTMIALEKLLAGESFETVDHSFGPLHGIVIDENMQCRQFTL